MAEDEAVSDGLLVSTGPLDLEILQDRILMWVVMINK